MTKQPNSGCVVVAAAAGIAVAVVDLAAVAAVDTVVAGQVVGVVDIAGKPACEAGQTRASWERESRTWPAVWSVSVVGYKSEYK